MSSYFLYSLFHNLDKHYVIPSHSAYRQFGLIALNGGIISHPAVSGLTVILVNKAMTQRSALVSHHAASDCCCVVAFLYAMDLCGGGGGGGGWYCKSSSYI